MYKKCEFEKYTYFDEFCKKIFKLYSQMYILLHKDEGIKGTLLDI